MALNTETDRFIAKGITLEDHISHAASHLGRAARHLQSAKEHHGEIATYGGISKGVKTGSIEKADAAGATHHMHKVAEYVGRAHEQQQMAVRHLNALTGDQQYGDNQKFKAGDNAAHMTGMHLANAIDHLHQLSRHLIAPVGSTGDTLAAHHHKEMGAHIAAAEGKIGEAKDSLKSALDPVAAQQNMVGSPETPAHKTLTVSAVADVPEQNLSIFKTVEGGEAFSLFVPIQKMEKAEMDTDAGIRVPGLMVKGWGSVSEYRDSQGDIITAEALIDAVNGDHPDAYAKWANIRSMHKAEVIGSAPVIDIREHPITKTPALWLEAFIVDKDAINKFLTRAYRGFSIGGACLASEPLAEAAEAA